jgi:hypothetical protein
MHLRHEPTRPKAHDPWSNRTSLHRSLSGGQRNHPPFLERLITCQSDSRTIASGACAQCAGEQANMDEEVTVPFLLKQDTIPIQHESLSKTLPTRWAWIVAHVLIAVAWLTAWWKLSDSSRAVTPVTALLRDGEFGMSYLYEGELWTEFSSFCCRSSCL